MQVGRKLLGEAEVLSIDDPIPNKLLDTIIEVEGLLTLISYFMKRLVR